MLASAALAFLAVYLETGSRLQSEIDRDLSGDVTLMSASVQTLRHRSITHVTSVMERYVKAQPYTATSTLLFMLVPSRREVVSNHVEVFYTGPPDQGETEAQQAVENHASAELRIPRTGYSTQRVADVGRVRVLERRLALPSGTVVLGAGEPLAGVAAAKAGILRALLLVAAPSLLLAVIASYFVGRRLTAPLRRMALVAARVDAGDLEPRMGDDSPAGSEVEGTR